MATLNSFNPVGSFQTAKRNALSMQAQQQGLNREAAAAPNRNALNDLNLQQAKVGAARKDTQYDQTQAFQSAKILNNAFKALRGIAPENRMNAAQSLAPQLAQFGITQPFAIEDLEDAALDQDIAESGVFLQDPKNISASQRERSDLIKAVTPALNEQGQIDVSKLDANSRSAAMALGLIAKSGTVTGQERIAQTPGLSEDVANLEGLKSSKKEVAKLTAQLKLKPEVESAVVSAVAQAKADAGIAEEGRSNEKALNVYEASKANLITALGGTITGPGAGYLPALTADAQIANGAIAMMAPVLKQMFRASGEGTFTDSDQKMLLNMIPTRDTLPAARLSQLAAIDSIVAAKLGSPAVAQQGASGKGEGKIMIDASGNRARVFPDGSFEEL
tara:strand:- start:21147 stop:22316 length:1170 start_codon:yes stop_codon:yes gene_type:complete